MLCLLSVDEYESRILITTFNKVEEIDTKMICGVELTIFNP